MDTVIVLAIVGWAVFYLVRRYVSLMRPKAENTCECGCSGCGQAATCTPDTKSIQSKP